MKTTSICCVLTVVLLTMTRRAVAFQLPFTRTVTAAAAKKVQLRDNSSSIKPSDFPSLDPQGYKHRSNVTKEKKKKKNKRILALVTTCSTLPTMLLQPKAAAAAAAATSSILTTPQQLVVDPALLTSTAGEEFGAVSVALGTSNNFVQTFVTTTMATIQMKQRSMIMFALALGMVATLLKCAEGGYVKLIEFMIDRCLLGYYGVGGVSTKNDSVRKVSWDEYMSQYLPKRKGSGVGGKNKKSEEFVLDKQTMLFQPVAVARDDNTMMKKATQTYREKQYEQHHHLVHVDKGSSANTASFSSSRKYLDTLSKFSTSPLNRHHLDHDTYLDSLSQDNTFMTPNSRTTSSWSGYKNTLHSMILNQAEHNEASSKLQILKNLLTWEDYKHLVTKLQMKKEECTKLEEEVTTLKKLLQEAGGSGSSISSNDDGLELKILEDKAKEYDETVKESKENEGSVRWH